MNPWEKWTPELLIAQAEYMAECNHYNAVTALEAFAALLQAEREGKRCVLPGEVADKELESIEVDGVWESWESGESWPKGKGPTQQAAIEDLAAKIRGEA